MHQNDAVENNHLDTETVKTRMEMKLEMEIPKAPTNSFSPALRVVSDFEGKPRRIMFGRR